MCSYGNAPNGWSIRFGGVALQVRCSEVALDQASGAALTVDAGPVLAARIAPPAFLWRIPLPPGRCVLTFTLEGRFDPVAVPGCTP